MMMTEVHRLLAETLIGDTTTILQAVANLQKLALNNGFCLNLMEIIDEETIHQSIKQAAINQLKLNIKNRWSSSSQQRTPIDMQEKMKIRNFLMRAVMRCSRDYHLLKQYCEVVTLVVGFENQKWIGLEEIMHKLSSNQDLSATLFCLLAVEKYFKSTMLDHQIKVFMAALRVIFPELLKVIKNHISKFELLYLAAKFLCKILTHFDLPIQIKHMLFEWMDPLAFIINSYSQQLNAMFNVGIDRYSPEFYYFHAKKWATRCILMLIQKHAKSRYSKQPAKIQFSENWHKQYGAQIIDIIVQQIVVPSISKLKYYQFRVIEAYFLHNQKVIYPYIWKLQTNQLLYHISLTEEEMQKSIQVPIQFIREEQDLEGNVRQICLTLWKLFMKIDSHADLKSNTFMPGQHFFHSFQFLKSLLGQIPISKEVSFRILCKIKDLVVRVPNYQNQMQSIIQEIAANELHQNSIPLLKVRANQVIECYGELQYQEPVLTQIASGVLQCLLSDKVDLVRIKAMTAFRAISGHGFVQKIAKQYLQQIFVVSFDLIKKYDLQELLESLHCIIKVCQSDDSSLAVALFKNLIILIPNIISNNKYDSHQIERTVSTVFTIMNQITQAPLNPQARKQIESQIMKLCSFMFKIKNLGFLQEILSLLDHYLHYSIEISEESWWYFQVVCYLLVGIPQQAYKQIQQSPKHVQALIQNINRPKYQNIGYISIVFPVLRNYIVKSTVKASDENFRVSFTQMLFYVVGEIYNSFTLNKYQSDEQTLNYSTIILTTFVETFHPEWLVNPQSTMMAIWSLIKFNNFKSKSVNVKLVTSQLVAVCFWKSADAILKCVGTEPENFHLIVNYLQNYHDKFQESYQRKRIILGILGLLGKWEFLMKQKELLARVPTLFFILLRLIFMNCLSRKIKIYEQLQNQQQINKNIRQLSNINQQYFQTLATDIIVDGDNQFNYQCFSDRYASALTRYDEINEFQKCMETLQNQSQTFYCDLIGTVPGQLLNRVKQQLEETQEVEKNGKESDMID